MGRHSDGQDGQEGRGAGYERRPQYAAAAGGATRIHRLGEGKSD